MFKWDGSNVTDILLKAEILEGIFNKTTYWIIKLDRKYTCIVKNKIFNSQKSGNNESLPCIIDEIKPLFGLPKVGSHWCKLFGKHRVLLRCTDNDIIREDIALNKLDMTVVKKNQILFYQIQELFTFRELLGITQSFNSNVVVRTDGKNVYPLSINESSMVIDDSNVLPTTVLDLWFEDTSVDKVALRLLKVRSINDIKNIHKLRSDIEKVIERVDRRNIIYASYIVTRIIERLQAVLNV